MAGHVLIHEAAAGRSPTTRRRTTEAVDRTSAWHGKEGPDASTFRVHRTDGATHTPDPRWDDQPAHLHGKGAGAWPVALGQRPDLSYLSRWRSGPGGEPDHRDGRWNADPRNRARPLQRDAGRHAPLRPRSRLGQSRS